MVVVNEDRSFPEALLDLYVSLDRDIAAANPVCNLSGRCCRFKEYGHTLFLSRPEANVLLEPGLPTEHIDENLCPFQVNGLCTARERRPMGCRVYFCDPNYAGVGEAISERYVSSLKKLHELTGVPWDYRPLHDYLREHVRIEGIAAEITSSDSLGSLGKTNG
jgi:hypothetical protein